MERNGSELDLPGFRFHPTEEELLEFYLRRAACGKKLKVDIIGTLNLYLYDPWDLPAMAKIGEREWYFFVPRDRRHSNGGRPNRTTERGFWKATGSDRPIRSVVDSRHLIGLKKTLVYYRGRAPRGSKTDWVMNEYRLPSFPNQSSASHHFKEDIVLCKVYRKAASLKELEHRAAMEQDNRASHRGTVLATSSDQEDVQRLGYDEDIMEIKEELEINIPNDLFSSSTDDQFRPPTLPLLNSSEAYRQLPIVVESTTKDQGELNQPSETSVNRQLPKLPALQAPNHTSFDWVQDPFLSQLRSPWLDQWSPLYANLLNF